MTPEETSNRLDIELSRHAKGIIINEYFKSLYLTKAQTYFVDHILKTYEYGDNIRHVLGKLLLEKTLTPTNVIGTELGLQILPLEAKVKQILYERTNDTIETIPVDFNDIFQTIENPFRTPSDKISYRSTLNDKIKLYTSETFLKYYYIYCKTPEPIVLEDFPDNLEIQGITQKTGSELPYDSILRVIEVASNLIYKDKARFSREEKPQQKT